MDYKKTFIYKITCKNESILDCYVGHSTNFEYRKKQHQYNLTSEKCKAYKYRIYEFIRSNGYWNNFKMEIIEHYPCENKQQALLREKHFQKLLNAELGIKAERTKEEEIIYKAQWFQDNKERIKEKNSEMYVCGCGASIQICEKIRHEKSKTHKCFMENKQIWLYPYTCGCGKVVLSKKSRHDKTIFHINNI